MSAGVCALMAQASAFEWVRLRLELALLLGFLCLIGFCWRAGTRPAVIVAAVALVGALRFLAIEVDQLGLHVLVGGGERVLFGTLLADAVAATAKGLLLAALAATLALAAFARGGRGREVHRMLLSAFFACLCVDSAYPVLALVFWCAAYCANHARSETRAWRSVSFAQALTGSLLVLALGTGWFVDPETLRSFEVEPNTPPLTAALSALCWIAAWAAWEWHWGTATAVARLGIGAPRFWSEVGLRLALLACAWRNGIHWGFARSSAAAFVATPWAQTPALCLALLASLLLLRSYWLRWRATDLESWTRQTLAGISAWNGLLLGCLSGAGLRGAVCACIWFALVGTLLHAAIALARREPNSSVPILLGGVALILSIPWPHSLADYAMQEVWTHLRRSDDRAWQFGLIALHVVGWCGGALALKRIADARAANPRVLAGVGNTLWPRLTGLVLGVTVLLGSALLPYLEPFLRSGRIESSEVRSDANRDDFLGRRYERLSVSN